MTMAGSVRVAMPLTADAFFGVSEGNRLRILAKKLRLAVNHGFTDDLVMLETSTQPIQLGPLTLRVIGPNRASLDALRVEWLKWLAKTEQKIASDPTAMTNSDKSVPNLSSIVLLAECDHKTILLTGDARSDHIVSGLDQAGLLTDGKLHVDVMKVAHHGSDRNHTAKFFKTVTAGKYVISANGKDDNPDLKTLEWIVEAAHAAERPTEIIVTNATPTTKAIKASHKPSDFGYQLTVKPETEHSIGVSLS